MSTKLATLKTILATLALSAIALAGCGSKGTTGNVVHVVVFPTGTVSAPQFVIVTQSLTFSTQVTGTTNTDVTWSCTYATTTFDSSGKPVTGTAQKCDPKTTGSIPDGSSAATVVFTAPQSVPDARKIAGNNCTDATKTCLLEVTITATSVADTKQTGTSVLTVDSGISVTLSPPTATVPTSASFQFNATLTNDLQTQGVTWLISQGTIDLSKGINFPQLTTCSPACGTIANAGDAGNPTPGFYTAPPAVPTTATVTLVATSKADPTRFAVGTITIAKAGDIKFNGISPLAMPQGAAVYDLYIFAPGVTSASSVTLSNTSGTVLPFASTSANFKILFPIPTATDTAPTSTGIRIRLDSSVLSAADTWTVDVSDPNHPPTKGSGPFKFSVVPVRATSFATVPDSYVQGSSSGGAVPVLINGGYFGNQGSLVQTIFQGTPNVQNSATSRQVSSNINSSAANSAQPGLHQLAVSRESTPLPVPNNSSITNFTLFPNYQNTPLAEGVAVSTGVDGKTLTQPTAIDIDQKTGMVAVAVTGTSAQGTAASNRVDFFQVGGSGGAGTLTPRGFTTTVNAPTSVSIDHTLHRVAVVSFQDQTVSVFPLPAPNTSSTVAVPPIATISLQGLIPPSAGTTSNPFVPPFPYSVGVDSDTHHALVAYSSSSNPTTARIGFLLDLNTGASDCLKVTGNPATSPCVSAQVTLTTGQYPQIAILPHSHTAVVTPGGLGSTAGINVLQTSSAVPIKNVSLTSNLVTVKTTTDHGINPITPGTVMIANVPNGTTNNVNFNGAFPVLSVIDSTTFTYALAQTVNDTAVGINCTDPKDTTCTPAPSLVFFGTPNISISGLSQTTQGIAVNQLTGLVAAADANATGTGSTIGPQINLLNSLDQSLSSITFRTTNPGSGTVGCTFYTVNCAGGAELLGTTSVAFQPYANLLVSYNGPQNQLSVSNPATLQRHAWLQMIPAPTTAQASQSSVTVQVNVVGPPASIVPITLALNGGLAVDAATNQALIVNSGTGTIKLVGLGPVNPTIIKPVHVTEVLVPSAAPSDPLTQGGIPGANFPQGTLTSAADLAGVKIFGAGFTGAGTTVHLDGTALSTVNVVSDREIDVTIPASFLTVPHHYALDVVSGGATSNVSDFFVVKSVDLSGVCQGTKPTSVAIADQLALGSFAPIAIVTNGGCNNVSVIDIAPRKPTFDNAGNFTGFVDNPPNGANTAGFGTFFNIAAGSSPSGVAVSPRFGLAIVANNGGGTASVLDILNKKSALTADVATGSGPIGVAINEGTGAALVANTAQNTVSEINLGLLFPAPGSTTAPPTTLTATSIGVDTAPIAIAIDPDRGTNENGLAVVTALALSSNFPHGVLDAVDIGSTSPARSTSAATGTVSLTPTGVVFDPSVNPTLFYAVSSSGNLVAAFNPDTGSSPSVRVGVNPTSLALNPQTGQIMTVNTLTNTVSIIDSLSFKTRASFGLPGPPPPGVSVTSLQTNQVAIDQFLNMAVIVDQAHNRVLLFPMPN